MDGPGEANTFGESILLFKSALVLPKQKGMHLPLICLISKCTRNLIPSNNLEYSFETLGPNLENYQSLYSQILLDKQRGYLGERKGCEVCLPSLENWNELQNIVKL